MVSFLSGVIIFLRKYSGLKLWGKNVSASEVNTSTFHVFIHVHGCILLLDSKPQEDHVFSIPNVWSMTGAG